MTRARFSAGTGPTRTSVPAAACDCHMHVYDARCPTVPGARLVPPDADLDDYRALQQRIGTSRTVCVTPSTYGTDNRVMLDALAALGAQARGIAVVDDSVGDLALQRLADAGVRGIRFNLSLGVSVRWDMLAPLCRRIAPLGWHVQLLAPADDIAAHAPLLQSLPVPLVLDHMAKIPPAVGPAHPAFALVGALMAEGRAWVKLSGAYLLSTRHAEDWPDVAPLARAWLDRAPSQVLWGSNWPHATASAGHHPLPDDARQMDALARWAGSAARLHQVLVDNPARLYGFA
jgi:predicted TIM-barrel fold metal-dependent hydrolase